MAVKLAEPYLLNILNNFNTKNGYPKNSCLQCSRSAALERVNKVDQINGLKLIGITVGSLNFRFILPSLNDSSCMCAQGGESFLGRGHTTKLVAELLDSQPEVKLTIYIVSQVF